MRREDDNPLNSVSATKPPQLHKSRASLEHAFELEEGSAPSPADHAENRDHVAAEGERDGVVDNFCNRVNEVDLQEVPRGVEGSLWDFAVGLGGVNGKKGLPEMKAL